MTSSTIFSENKAPLGPVHSVTCFRVSPMHFAHLEGANVFIVCRACLGKTNQKSLPEAFKLTLYALW